MLGRLTAWEQALFTVSETVSSVAVGAALDRAHATLGQVMGVLLGLSVACTAGYGVWASVLLARSRDLGPAAGGGPGRAPTTAGTDAPASQRMETAEPAGPLVS